MYQHTWGVVGSIITNYLLILTVKTFSKNFENLLIFGKIIRFCKKCCHFLANPVSTTNSLYRWLQFAVKMSAFCSHACMKTHAPPPLDWSSSCQAIRVCQCSSPMLLVYFLSTFCITEHTCSPADLSSQSVEGMKSAVFRVNRATDCLASVDGFWRRYCAVRAVGEVGEFNNIACSVSYRNFYFRETACLQPAFSKETSYLYLYCFSNKVLPVGSRGSGNYVPRCAEKRIWGNVFLCICTRLQVRNEPCNVTVACEYIAQIKKLDAATVALKLFPKLQEFLSPNYNSSGIAVVEQC